MKSLKRLVSGTVRLRTVFIVPFVLQIGAAVGLTGYLSLRNGQKAVNEVTTQLRREITANNGIIPLQLELFDQPTIWKMNDAIGNVQNAIVVSHQQDGTSLLFS